MKKQMLKIAILLLLTTSTLFAYSDGEQIKVTNCSALADYEGVSEEDIDYVCKEGTYTFSEEYSEFRIDNGDYFYIYFDEDEDVCVYYEEDDNEYVIISDSSITSLEDCVGITAGISINFETAHVPLNEDIGLEFSENMQISNASAEITLYNASNNSVVESFSLNNSSHFTLSGANLTLKKTVALQNSSTYYIQIPADAFVTQADNSIYDGITDTTSLSFKTNYLATLGEISDVTLDKNAQAYTFDIDLTDDEEGDRQTLSVTADDTALATFSLVTGQIGADIDGEAGSNESGSSVSLSSYDGSIVAIGAFGNNNSTGHVRIYKNSNGTWKQIGDDINGEAELDKSGSSVSLSSDGSIVAIGAPYNSGSTGNNAGHVRIYKNNNGTWEQVGADIDGENQYDYSGKSVSLSSDGSVVAIGATNNDGIGMNNAGHVRIYKKNSNGTWEQVGADIDGEAADDYSGSSVSLSSDGSIVAIGAIGNDGTGSYAGHVRIYKNTNNTWTQVGDDIDGEATYDNSGYSVSLSSDGSIVAIGAHGNDNYTGHVRIYKNSNNTWTQVGVDIDGENQDDKSGYSVSLSSDGSIVAIGTPNNNTGHVRIYKNSNSTWTKIGTDIDGENQDDESGKSVSLSSDGSIVAIGAPNNNNYTGHVRVFNTKSTLTITPKTDAEGLANVTVTANDGYDDVNQTFTLIVGNVAPTASDVSFSIDEDNNKTFESNDFNFTDANPSDSVESLIISTLPTSGSLTLYGTDVTLNQSISVANIPNLVFSPVANANGTPYDSFGFKVDDGNPSNSISIEYSATINVTSVDDAPSLDSITKQTVTEDFSDFNITLISNDVDGDDIIYTIGSSDTSIATVSIVDGNVTVKSIANASGTVTVEVNATANGLTSTQNFDIEIADVDDAPTLDTITNPTDRDEDFSDFNITLSANDIDSDLYTFGAISNNTNRATVSVVGDKLVISSVANASGEVTIDINVTQDSNSALSDTQTINFYVNAVNDTPTFTTNLTDITINEDNGTTSYELNVTDIEGGELNITVESNNTDILTLSPNWSGLLSQGNYADGLLEFNLSTVQNRYGLVQITVMVNDGELNSTSTYDVNISSVNDTPTFTTNLTDITINKNNFITSYELNVTDIEGGELNITVESNNTDILTLSPNWSGLLSQGNNYVDGLLEFNLSRVQYAYGLVEITIMVNDGELNSTSTYEININDSDSDGDGVLDSIDSCPDTYGNQSDGCYVTPYVASYVSPVSSNLMFSTKGKENNSVQSTETDTQKILEVTLEATNNSNTNKTTIKLDIPKNTQLTTNQDLKQTLTIVNSDVADNINTKTTTLKADIDTEVKVKKDGSFEATKNLNDGSNTQLLVKGGTTGNLEVSLKDSKTSTTVEIPAGSNTEITKDGAITANTEFKNEDGSATLKVAISLTKSNSQAVITSSAGDVFLVKNYDGSTESIMSFIKANVIKRVVGETNNYSGVRNIFKSSKNFFAYQSEDKTVEIIPTTGWQKFEEIILFNGKRTIKLLLGDADIVIDGEKSTMIKNEVYLLPLEVVNTNNMENKLNPIYENNSLKLTSGWNLISSPINSELDVIDVFGTNDVAYKFENNSWIKNPETLTPNEGMWIKYGFNIYVHFDEFNTTESYDFNSSKLTTGWNLVGTGADVDLNSSNYKNIWAFDNIDKTWVSNPNSILRGYGFWIKR